MGKEFEKKFSKEDTHVSNNYMEKWWTLLPLGNYRPKPQWDTTS
jgi:hypothetical protein